jgi:nanoRNase/pAp phosphatase (c-di-AMP/oligoRNAs hydrolase)
MTTEISIECNLVGVNNNKEYKKFIIVYHKNCLDGLGSAWVIKYYLNSINVIDDDIILIPQYPKCNDLYKFLETHGLYFGEVEEEYEYNIIFVDIFPEKDILLKLMEYDKKFNYKNRIEIYDHHQTNKEILLSLSDEIKNNICYIFDMEKCGCQIAWNVYMKETPRPKFIDYIGEGDLWNFKSPDSKLIYEELYNSFLDIDKLTWLYHKGDEYFINKNENSFNQDYLHSAKIIHNYKQKKINKYISSARIKHITINNLNMNNILYPSITFYVYVSHCTDIDLISDLGNQLTNKKFALSTNYKLTYTKIEKEQEKEQEITLTKSNESNEPQDIFPDFVILIKEYKVENGDMVFYISFRSNKLKKPLINVGDIAKHFNGGGHAQASGCEISYNYFKLYFL